MNKIVKKYRLTLILIIIFIILLIVNFLIPEKRTVTKILTAEEYKNQIYNEVYYELVPEENKVEEDEKNELEMEIPKNRKLYN
ncbi:MAG: hypothetical protein J6J60_07050 [Clostridia bacterium]|nr:hypothetical protein [Clostridia bacterium]